MRNTRNEKFKIYDYKGEYHDRETGVCHIIATDMEKDELEMALKEAGIEAAVLKAYIVVPMEYANIVAEYDRNTDKFEKRAKRNEDLYGYEDGEAEKYHHELVIDEDFIEQIFEYDRIESEKRLISFRQAMKSLSEVQRRRVVKYFYEKKSLEMIAAEEGCTKTSIRDSINLAVKKVKRMTI